MFWQLHVSSSRLDSDAETNLLLYEHVISWWSGGAGSGGVVGGGNIWNSCRQNKVILKKIYKNTHKIIFSFKSNLILRAKDTLDH